MNARTVKAVVLLWISVGMMTGQTLRAGRIEGVVVNAASDIPIPGARVAVLRDGLPTELTTDGNGRFAFEQLEPAGYRLQVTEPGYVRYEYRTGGPTSAPSVIKVESGSDFKDIVIRLVQTGNVSGRLTNDFGRPAVGVPVQLIKTAFGPTGQRILQSVGTVRTNDRGEYRLYWVTPDRYYLVAGSTGAAIPTIFGPSASPNVPNDNFGFTFYPGVTDVNKAISFAVNPGSDMVLDLPVSSGQLYRIAGQVAAAQTGKSPKSLSVTVSYSANIAGNSTISFSGNYQPTTGMFSVRPMPRGSYLLMFSGNEGSARVPIDLTNHIDQLTVVLSPSMTIRGRIVMEAASEQLDVRVLRVHLTSVSMPGSIVPAPSTHPDGTFSVENLIAGDYRVALRPEGGLPDSYAEIFIKEARFDRVDVLQEPFTVSHTTPADAVLTILASANGGVIEGLVLDQKLQPTPASQVVLVPERNRDRHNLYKAAIADGDGRFTIRGIPPGDYRLFAWQNLEPHAYFDPAVLRAAESAAKFVHVTEGSRQSVDLSALP